jgi:ATP-dependent Zn protease
MSVITKGDDGQTIPPPIPSARIPKRTWIVWIVILVAIIALVITKQRTFDSGDVLSQQRFEQLMEQGKIVQGTVHYDNQDQLNKITGTYEASDGAIAFVTRVRLTPALENRLYSSGKFEPREKSQLLLGVGLSVLPFILIGLFIWFFFIRQIKKAAANPNSAQARYDRLLDKWEEQANRMDNVLDRLERERRE